MIPIWHKLNLLIKINALDEIFFCGAFTEYRLWVILSRSIKSSTFDKIDGEYLTNGAAEGSQAELGNRKTKHAILVNGHVVLGNEYIKDSHRESQTSLKLLPDAMKDYF
jgi:hypothetical protein